ncbi:MAG: GntR family transcriptional regulator [Lachnospiraceae bacterium]|nr:GntR family transcriptional regulator [Lachnospiraceae bacterium]
MKNPTKPTIQIKKISAADQVCDIIKENIQNGEWPVGERLPAESELASMFGVNRLTVRLALQKLNTLGIVETRTGSGTYVIEFDFNNYIKGIRDFYLEPELLENVCEFRKTLEIECVRLAVQRAEENEFDQLEALLEKYQAIVSNISDTSDYYHAVAKADIAFHKKICEMSHNKLYLYAFTVAQAPIYQYILLLNKKRADAYPSASEQEYESTKMLHQNIFNSLKNRDFETCKRYYLAMINHDE